MPEGSTPTEPGWYNDPAGRYSHQAYWDGEKWTGATRPTTAPTEKWVRWLIILLAVLFGLFVLMVMIGWGLLEILLPE